MINIKNNKIIIQIMEILKKSPLTLKESFVLSLQLLCLPKLSKKGLLSKEVNIEDLSNMEVFKDTWEALAEDPGKIGVAYSHSGTLNNIDHSILKRAVDFCVKVSLAGLLDDFDPTDCMSSISGRKTGEFAIPPELADLIVKIADIKAGMSVYTPWDNTGQLSSRAARLGADVCSEVSVLSPVPALISLFMESCVDITHTDPICEPCSVEGGNLKKFDVTIAFLPIGLKYDPQISQMDLYNRFPEVTKSGNVLAFRHVLSQTKRKAVLVVPNVLLFSPGSELALRKDIISKGIIETVIALPSGLLQTTNIPLSAIVLDLSAIRQNVRFINADTDRYREMTSKARSRMKNIDYIFKDIYKTPLNNFASDMVSVDYIIKNDFNLQINRYGLSDPAKKINVVLAKSKTIPFSEIVSVIRPMPIKLSNSTIKAFEIGAVNLPDYGYIEEPIKIVETDKALANKNKQRFIQPNDVILVIKGNVGRVGLAPDDAPEPGENGWVVGQSAIILRVKNKDLIDAKVLTAYLRSNVGRQLIENIKIKGATVPMLQLKELQKLMVVSPSEIEAAEIVAAMDDQAKIQKEIEDLKKRQASLTQKFWPLV